MGEEPSDVTVLVVDDEPLVADTFSLQLDRWYDTRTAHGGEEALDLVDADVDVVFLDRRMPGISGDEVLRAIRDRGLDVRVVMVTAVDADFDILSMPCDGYLRKPVDGTELHETVEQQLAVRRYDERVSEYFSATDKIAALEADRNARELDSNEEYAELRKRQAALREELDALFETIDDDLLLFRDPEIES